jgi:hypothetical protein
MVADTIKSDMSKIDLKPVFKKIILISVIEKPSYSV